MNYPLVSVIVPCYNVEQREFNKQVQNYEMFL